MRACAPSTTSSTRETDDAPTQDSRDRPGRRRADPVRAAAARHASAPTPPPASDGARRVSHSFRIDPTAAAPSTRSRPRRRAPACSSSSSPITATARDRPMRRRIGIGVLTIDGVELNTTGGHYAAIGLPAVAVSDRRHARRRHRGRASARRIRHRRASRIAAAVAGLAGLGRADRRPRVDQRRQRVARRAACVRSRARC